MHAVTPQLRLSQPASRRFQTCDSLVSMSIHNLLVLLPLLLLTSMSGARLPPHAACDTPAHASFDFWIGHWDVIDSSTGRVAGINQIERMDGGCLLRERYQTSHGYSGQSLNWYDPGTRRWHQLWLDSDGLVLQFAGDPDPSGGMLLEGVGRDSIGPTIERMRWEVRPNGTLRQLWTQARKPEGPWITVFDGIYRRRTP